MNPNGFLPEASVKSTMENITFANWLAALADPETTIEVVHTGIRRQPLGWQGATETLNAHLLCFVETGAILGKADGASFRLDAGDVIWFPPDTTRQIRNAPNLNSAVTVRIRFKLLNRNRSVSWLDKPLIKTGAWELAPYLNLMLNTWRQKDKNCNDEFGALLTAFSIRFNNCPDQDEKHPRRVFNQRQRDRLMELIFNHSGPGLTPAKLAKAVGYNADYFSRLFKNSYGVSAKTFLKEERLRHAAQLLLDGDLTVKEICAEIGENNVSKFHRQFKAMFGVTPNIYRGGK